jgi:hypothetical protein
MEGSGGYYQGKIPQVPQVTGYSLEILDTAGSLQWQTVGEPYTPHQENGPTNPG